MEFHNEHRKMSLSLDEFRNDFWHGNLISDELTLTEDIIQALGFGSRAKEIFEKLTEKGINTWRGLLTIESKQKAIELVGDRYNGGILWGTIHVFMQKRDVELASPMSRELRYGNDEFLSKLPLAKWEDEDVLRFETPRHETFDKILFVRECYRGLYPTILETVRVGDKCVVTGTSGIGVSFFGLYSAKRFLEEGLTVIHIDRGWDWANLYLPHTPSDRVRKVLADHCKGQPEGPWAGRFNGSRLTLSLESIVFYDALTELVGEVVVIVDPSADLGPGNWVSPNCGMLVVTNPVQEQKDTFKRSGCVMTYYLPVWTEVELKNMLEKRKGAPLTEEEARQLAYRVKRFGGNPQIVARSNCSHHDMVSEATDVILSVINTLQVDRIWAMLDPMYNEDASKLVHFVPASDFTFDWLRFASEMILQEVVSHVKKQSLGLQTSALETAISGVKRFAPSTKHLNESLWHVAMKQGGSFKIAPLGARPQRNQAKVKYVRGVTREVVIPPTAARYSFQENLSDIESLWDLQAGEKGIYVHFPKGNVPFFDSICVIDGQMANKIFGTMPSLATMKSPSEPPDDGLVRTRTLSSSSEQSLFRTRTPSASSEGSLARKQTPSVSPEGNLARKRAPSASSEGSLTRKRTKSSVSSYASTTSPPCVLLHRMIRHPDHKFDETALAELISKVKSLCPPGTAVHFCWVTAESAAANFKYPIGGDLVISQIPQWLIMVPDEALLHLLNE